MTILFIRWNLLFNIWVRNAGSLFSQVRDSFLEWILIVALCMMRGISHLYSLRQNGCIKNKNHIDSCHSPFSYRLSERGRWGGGISCPWQVSICIIHMKVFMCYWKKRCMSPYIIIVKSKSNILMSNVIRQNAKLWQNSTYW